MEYLFVTLTHGFPETPRPLFKDQSFPTENREYLGESQELSNVAKALRVNQKDDKFDISNFSLLCFIHQMGGFCLRCVVPAALRLSSVY